MGGFVVAGVAALFVALVVLGMLSGRKRLAARRQRAVQMGFSPVAHPDPALVKRLSALHRRHGGKVTLRNAFRKEDPDYQVYLLDTNASGGDQSTLAEDVVVLVSPHLRLPRLTLIPKAPGQGLLATLANGLIESALARSGASAVEFPDYPQFGRRYALLGESEAEVRAAFTEDALGHLSEAGSCIVEAGDDTLLVARLPHAVAQGDAAQIRLEESIREAVILFDLLRKA